MTHLLQAAAHPPAEQGTFDGTLQGPPQTGSEDFAFMLERLPGSCLLIGHRTGEGASERGCMVHNPGCDFNDANIGIGSAYRVLLAERFLTAKGPDAAS